MKKILLLIFLSAVLSTLPGAALADGADGSAPENFAIVKTPFPKDIEDRDNWRTVARYKDSGQPITLSMYYDGYVYATVPTENKNREIEAFIPEKVSFTDYDASQFEFIKMEDLSRTGVIVGNEKGEAKPLDTVTRAEATAMVMRFLGLSPEDDYELVFDDVKPGDWFYGCVAAARKCGIVVGDSETTFSPNRNVTREEIVVMTARALKYADLRCPDAEIADASDRDQISDWAVEAYDYIGVNYPSDYDDTDPEHPMRILGPQKAATRYDVACVLSDTARVCQLYSSETAVKYGFDREMPVIDGSTSTYPFTQAVYEQLFCNGRAHEQYPSSHSKSHASYQRLIDGEVDMLFASVYPASDILAMAEEKGVALELIPIAYDAMIFFTNADNPAEGLTKEQISEIYVNDAYDNWSELGGPDALLYPYCRNNDSGSHAQMERHFLKGNEIHERIRQETTSVSMSNVLTDVMEAQTSDPAGYGLGYSIYYYFNNMDMFYNTKTELKLLSIDGVAPTDETIADGSYPLSNYTYVVLRKDTPKDAPARKMAEFMLTEEGQACVENAGYGRLEPGADDAAAIAADHMLFADKLNVQMPEDRNYMFSPLSIKMALALAANGAEGETKAQLLNATGISDLETFNALSENLISRYNQADVLTLDIANSIWMNRDRTRQNFSGAFKTLAAKYYHGDVMAVNNANAVKEINPWVSEKTNQKITQIVQDASFEAMLVNAIYFKAGWENEFNENATKLEAFSNADGTKSQIDFMNQTDWFQYAKTDDAQIVSLPYKNSVEKISDEGEFLGREEYEDLDVSMYVILGEEGISVAEALNAALENQQFSRRYIRLSMPKFKMEFEIGLNDILKNIGISRAFDSKTAEFQKMFDSGNMYFTNTVHKTYIDVDEKGTEAAAVTAIEMATSALPPEPFDLKFNRPFYFVIRDNANGEILFMGRYASAK